MTEPKAPPKKTVRKPPPKKRAPRKKAAPKTPPVTPTPDQVKVSDEPPGPAYPWPLRPHQVAVNDAFDAGIKRFLLAWHRRAGKDIEGLSMARTQMRKRVGGYVHFFPKHVQARRALWNGVDPGMQANFIDVAFGDIETSRNGTDMHLEIYNGSTWQLLGSDSYDRFVGANVVGAVFSEWALCDPRAWDFIRPILLENDGWAMFISTFRGRNHMWQMCQRLKDNPQWYVDVRTVADTVDVHGKRLITDELIQQERDAGMSEAMIQQEFYCNPEASAEGAIYGKQTERLRGDAQRHDASWIPSRPVYAVWNFDLPIQASRILVQPAEGRQPPQILAAETWEDVSLAEALSNCAVSHWPIQGHIIHERDAALLPGMADLGYRPELVRAGEHFEITSLTSMLVEWCVIDKARTEVLLDSLSGYVRRERFVAQSADIMYSETPLESWHSQLVSCLETWAIWSATSTHKGREPNYEKLDRIARTLR